MTAFSYAEESFLPEECGPGVGSTVPESLGASMGTFALRRAHYFNETAYFNEAKSFNESEQSSETVQESSLSAEQQQALANLMRSGDFVAKQKMIARCLPLVVDIAKRYTNRGVPLLSLLKEGKRGLIYAMEEFKAEDRFHFSTYAAQYIRQYIELAITNQHSRSGGISDHSIV